MWACAFWINLCCHRARKHAHTGTFMSCFVCLLHAQFSISRLLILMKVRENYYLVRCTCEKFQIDKRNAESTYFWIPQLVEICKIHCASATEPSCGHSNRWPKFFLLFDLLAIEIICAMGISWWWRPSLLQNCNAQKLLSISWWYREMVSVAPFYFANVF